MKIEPTFVEEPNRRVVGMVVRGKCQNNEIPAMWDLFVPRMSEVAIEGDCLGVIRWDENLPEGEFAYMAGFVSSMDPPAGMEAWEITGGAYARITVAGLLEIRTAIDSFHSDWLPSSGYVKGSLPSLELYPETFPQDPHFHLLFSVVKAS